MMNRLHLPWLRQLSLALGLFVWAAALHAQCECTSPTSSGNQQSCTGDLFTLTYTGQDTFFVGNDCMGMLPTLGNSITGAPAFNSITFDAALTGYTTGAMVMGGTDVTMHYIITDGMTDDTLCFNIFFIDTIPPEITTTLGNDTIACDLADYPAWLQEKTDSVMNNFTDNCGSGTVSHSGTSTFDNPCGTQEVTFYVTDDAGNQDSVMASYTTLDTVPPVLVGVPGTMLINCDDPFPDTAMVTATDSGCTGAVTIAFTETSTQAMTGCEQFDYTIQRTWTATDACGNSSSPATQIINVQDISPPTFDVPADTTVNCEVDTSIANLGTIMNLNDNCTDPDDLIITTNQVIIPGSCANEFTITRTWTVTDLCLNPTSASQVITVQDTTAPVVTFPADITVDCSDAADLNVTGEPNVMGDNCDTDPTVTSTDVNTGGSCDFNYTIERTWKVEDNCGNMVSQMQTITVKDTIAPVIGTEAANQTITCAMDIGMLFSSWINSHATAAATDNCSDPDSLMWTAFVSGTTDPAALPAPDCVNPEMGVFQKVAVDFIVSDECGNTDTTSATFTVADNNPPVLMNCPADMTVDTDPGICEATIPMLLPVVMEDCGNVVTPINVSQTLAPTIPSGMPPVSTPIDDLVFEMMVPMPPISANGGGTLTVHLDNIDAEQSSEYLNVFGEDGQLLGAVANTAIQCGDTTTVFNLTEAQLNEWAYDGLITITVKTNIPAGQSGIFAVNPICPDGTVTAELNYESNSPTDLKFEYSLDGGATRIQVSPVQPFFATFPQGANTMTYFFTDCAGNEASCEFDVTVEDNEAPEITCPADLSVTLGAGVCEADVEVPLFIGVTDNCGVTTPTTQTQATDSLGQLITFSFNPNLGDYVADDKTFTFTGLEGNATPGGVQLIVTVQGDVDSVGAYFEIYGNDNVLLGTTANGQAFVTPGNCNTPSVATFTIPATTFNDWASTGDITITAKSFIDYPIPPAGPGWGINPCLPDSVSANGDTDGSFISATFSYESISPTFSATGATIIAPMTLTPPLEATTYTLAQDTTTFTYSVTDLAGNMGECSFDVIVTDTEAPTALCGPAFVDINPSGFEVDTVYADEIDLGSTDNCTIASMTVTPSVFTCLDAGVQPITLTVADEAGNSTDCNTFVNVTTQAPVPSVSTNCGSPNLQLFANPPASAGGGNAIYTYVWRYNGVAIAFVENPIIQDADLSNVGFYTVEIEGVSGCTSQSSVQVTCNMLPLAEPTIQASNNVICASQTIQLTTAPVCGSTVMYKWYSGNFPGTLQATTTQPNYSLMLPGAGNFNFYVVVERNGCESTASDPVSVSVNPAPTAMSAAESIIVCEGEQILLQSINNPTGAACQWTGPAGYQSPSCNPAPITSSTSINAGFYTLVVTNNGCPSVPDTVVVNVVSRPAKPIGSSSAPANNPACDGTPITLTSTPVAGAISYQWVSPGGLMTMTTSTNVLEIPASDITKDNGMWTVQVIGNPCDSEVSDAFMVSIVNLPQAVQATAAPLTLCEGQSLNLNGESSTPNVSYTWTYPSGAIVASQNPVLNDVDNNDEGMYELLVTSQFGCTAEANVQVNVLDRVDITGLASDVPDCPTGPVDINLVATVFPPNNGSYEYFWTGPNGFQSTLVSPTILEATSTFGVGSYILTVTGANGCSSLPTTLEVDVPAVLAPPDAPTTTSGNTQFCEGQSLTLNTSGTSNAEYTWTTPSGTYSTTEVSLTLNDLTVSEEGAYTVQYEVNGCVSPVSSVLDLEVNPIPLIAPTSNSPVCEGDILELEVECDNGALYEWTGPNFNPSVCSPVILNADPDLHTGTYTVRKNLGGCWSEVMELDVEVKAKPAVPTAVSTGPFCADTEDIILSVTANSGTPNATYTWFDMDSVALGNATPALNFAIPNGTVFADGTHEFFAVATLDGCPSTPSFPATVTINTVPQNLAEAGENIDACEGDLLSLAATPPTIGTGMWTLAEGIPNGLVIANPDEASTTLDGLIPAENYMFAWTLSNGACENYSSDSLEVFVNFVEQANAGEMTTLCHTNELTLNGNTPLTNVGTWTQPQSQANLGITIDEPGNPNSTVSGIPAISNAFIFTWTIDGGCGSDDDQVIVNVSYEEANAGADFFYCGDEEVALPPANGDGVWSSPDGEIIFENMVDMTFASNLLPGENILVYTIEDGICEGFSTDSLILEYQPMPVLADDIAAVDFRSSINLDVTENDDIGGLFTASIVEDPRNGTATINDEGLLVYTANENFVGSDELVYEICGDGCECVTATVSLDVGANAECIPPTIFTPNDDGMNDAFVIPCLNKGDRFPIRILSIFNQWGDEVYHSEKYQNDWRGTFDNEDLPAGTYFYFLDLGNGTDAVSGYLILQR